MTKANLNLIEVFASIQGETHLAGLPTTFIRLAACNLRCTWCDTPYSFGRGEPHSLESILTQVKEYGCRYVCITGGEPLLQSNVHTLMQRLCDAGYHVSIETGGSLPAQSIDSRVQVILDLKCPGSGMSDRNHWPNLDVLRQEDAVKFVLLDERDYGYAKKICQKYNLYDRVNEVLFSPAHDQLEARLLVEWMLRDKIPARLNLQIHKFVWSPETQGV